jgi:hypothetical protein
MPQPVDEFASFTGKKPAHPTDEFASFLASAKTPVAPPPVQSVAAQYNLPDATKAAADEFKAFKEANRAPTPAEMRASYDAVLLESQGVTLDYPAEQVAPDPQPPGPTLMEKLKAIPGKVKAFAVEKYKEHRTAVQAQWDKMGVLAPFYPELAIEAGKSVVGKVQNIYQGLRPNDAKSNAEWAEGDMKALLKEVGDKEPTPAQLQRFKDRAAFAKQMWAMAETERGKRNEAVQGFQKRMDASTLPATPATKLVAPLAAQAAQVALAPQTIPIEMAVSGVANNNLRTPAYENTLGQQVKAGVLNYGMGKVMMAGFPGVPVSRALQNLGVNPVAANLTGMVPTSVTNVYGGHQLQRYLTTPHGDTPDAPGFTDFLHDYATQLGLGAQHLNQPLVNRLAAGTPGPGESSTPVPMGLTPLERPMAPGGLNLPAPDTAPLPAPAVVYGPAMRPALTPGTLDTVFPRLPANLRGQLGVQDAEPAAPAGTLQAPAAPIPELPPEVNIPQGPTSPPAGPLHPEVQGPAQRPQPNPLEGLPDAYGLAPVEVAPRAPVPKATLSEHEGEMAQTKQQRQGDREALVNGPVRETADIAPEHHAEADRIIEARNIVTVTERRAMEAEHAIQRLEIENRQRQADGKEPLPVPAEVTLALKNRNAPGMDELRQLAASEPTHPDAQRALQVAQEQQQALAAEYAASTPDGEGDITHASRIALKTKGGTPTFGEKVREFFGGASTQPAEQGIPGTGKRPKQKNEYSKERRYETVDGPTGPVVIYRDPESDGSHKIVGRSGTITESDITGRRESTKDEITHATSQVEVETPGEIDPDTGEPGPSRTEVEIDPSVAIHFSRNAVAGAAKARESARDAIRGRKVLDDLKANPKLFQQGEAKPGSEWRDVSELPITPQAKNRLAPGGKKTSVRSDAAQVLIEYFGQPTAKESSFLTGINAAARRWTERGLLTNVFAHFPNQFAHGLGALSGEGLTPQQATNALAHAYREGQNPNSEYVNRAKMAGVKQMSEGRQFGQNDNMTAHEAATAALEKALGHEAGTMGEAEGGSIKRAFKALNQKTVWQVDDAIRNTLFYQKIASGMTPEAAAKYANENYIGYHTDTNLFELSPSASPRRGDQVVKKGLNEIYRNLVTGKGETGKGFAGAGASLARTLVSPLFHTFRTNSATLLAHELKGAATGLPQGDLKGLGKLANIAAVGSAVGGVVGQSLSDAFLTEDQKKQGKEYQMRMGGPFHWYDTAEKALEGRATPMQTAAAIATPNPLFKHLIGKGIFGVDAQSGRRAPAASLAELGDTVLSSVLPTGDIARNALQGQGNAKDVVASFLMGKNAPNPAFQMMMAHPDKMAAGTPDYEASKANFRLISQLRDLEPGSKPYTDAIEQAVKEQLLTKRQIENAAKRSGQTELEHARALAKIATPEWAVKAGEWYAERSPEIALALYAEAQKKLGAESKKFEGQRNLKVLGQIQKIENMKLLLRNQ